MDEKEFLKEIIAKMYKQSESLPNRREEKDYDKNRMVIITNKLKDNEYKSYIESLKNSLKKYGVEMKVDENNKLSLVGENPDLAVRYTPDFSKNLEELKITFTKEKPSLVQLTVNGEVNEEHLNDLQLLVDRKAVLRKEIKNPDIFNKKPFSDWVKIEHNIKNPGESIFRLKTNFGLEKDIEKARKALTERFKY
jgi:hypothetical protein